MFHEQDLLGAEELLRDDYAAQGVDGGRSGLGIGVSPFPFYSSFVCHEGDTECRVNQSGRVRTLRMTCASPRSMPKADAGSIRASMQVRTRYCFAGGRASEPLVKVELYCCEDTSRLSWMALMLG